MIASVEFLVSLNIKCCWHQRHWIYHP